MNLFTLHGKHFREDENRLTANLAVMLHEARRGFLPAFLNAAGIQASDSLMSAIRIAIQEPHTHDAVRSIIDAKLISPGNFIAVIESKIGFNAINPLQALKYAKWLESQPFPSRVLIFVTQLRQPLVEQAVRDQLAAHRIASTRSVFLQWQQIFSLLRASESLSPADASRAEKRICKGLPVPSVTRFGHLFLEEVEKMAYELSVVDELCIGDVEDVVVQVQTRWFMDVALNHNTWFPPSSSLNGLRPAKYVAYYQTKDNELPSHLSHVARIRKVWKRVSFADVCILPEFGSLFANHKLADEVATFKNKEGLFHIAQTEKPVALAHPISLGNPSKAQFLTKKRFPLTRLLAAKTADDLFASRDADE